ncbi:hypothetical protein SRHO_G00124940 [Serrasalmus rhombeus]
MTMMKAPLWILGLFLYATCPVEAVELDERMFISVKMGENHTLSCNVGKSETNTIVWFKQQLGQEFQDVVTKSSNASSAFAGGCHGSGTGLELNVEYLELEERELQRQNISVCQSQFLRGASSPGL